MRAPHEAEGVVCAEFCLRVRRGAATAVSLTLDNKCPGCRPRWVHLVSVPLQFLNLFLQVRLVLFLRTEYNRQHYSTELSSICEPPCPSWLEILPRGAGTRHGSGDAAALSTLRPPGRVEQGCECDGEPSASRWTRCKPCHKADQTPQCPHGPASHTRRYK